PPARPGFPPAPAGRGQAEAPPSASQARGRKRSAFRRGGESVSRSPPVPPRAAGRRIRPRPDLTIGDRPEGAWESTSAGKAGRVNCNRIGGVSNDGSGWQGLTRHTGNSLAARLKPAGTAGRHAPA